ncbi:MAG: AAA family ATPase [Dehalococcoidia bacterium]
MWGTLRQGTFVGRGRELSVLTEQMEGAARAGGGVALVAGEPGIGKTRLLAELGSHARVAGWTVLSGRAYDSEGMPPYLPFVEALRGAIRDGNHEHLRTQLGPAAAAVALLLPELRDLAPALPEVPAIDPEQQRYRLFEAVSDAFEGIARNGETGLVLLLDDLHWADAPTLGLLRHLARRLDRMPMLVTAAYRTTEADTTGALTETLAALAREGCRTTVVLRPLPLDETAALAETIAGGRVAEPVVDAIQRATEGNPFLIGEVVRNLQSQGHDLGDRAVAQGEWAVPELVRQTTTARLSRVRPGTRDLLRHGAVLGDGFTFELVRAMGGLRRAARARCAG